MELRKLQRIVIDAIEDIKGQEIQVFNTTELTGLFDRVILVSGTSNRHTRSVAAHVVDQVKAAGERAVRIYAADKLTNVRMLRSAYELEGEEIGEELKVSLDEKIYIWELDLEMLFGAVPDLPIVKELADELAGLWSDRATEARASG